ncbi:MAG: type II toxin-antitoxin system HicB family antitoxin [Limisphaerales bacterium]
MKTAELTKSYVFPVLVEADGDAWRAYVPELEDKGAATWGHTREEALKNIQEVLQMVIEEMIEDGEPVPKAATVYNQPVVAVSV